MSEAKSGAGGVLFPDVASLIRATMFPEMKGKEKTRPKHRPGSKISDRI
jgi:hypothetical protein